jgi:hypothetical protein
LIVVDNALGKAWRRERYAITGHDWQPTKVSHVADACDYGFASHLQRGRYLALYAGSLSRTRFANDNDWHVGANGGHKWRD